MKKIIIKLILFVCKKLRIGFYNFISDHNIQAIKNQPVLAKGSGVIEMAKSVKLGVEKSPSFFSSYIYIEARKVTSQIIVGENTHINNNCSIISDGCIIKIGQNCLFGLNTQIIDSDFHDLKPQRRFGGGNVLMSDITIENNVFVGNNVSILKGVTIGENSVIANGSIVSNSIPNNVIAAGVPAKVLRSI